MPDKDLNYEERGWLRARNARIRNCADVALLNNPASGCLSNPEKFLAHVPLQSRWTLSKGAGRV